MKILYALIVVSLSSCSPRAIVKNRATDSAVPFGIYSFAMLENTSKIHLYSSNYLAEITTRVNAFTIGCDDRDIRRIVQEVVQNLGGNCALITGNAHPTVWRNGCGQLTATAYYVKEIHKLESIIEWHENRRLEIRDFKGPVKDRLFDAATSSYIDYHTTRSALGNWINIYVNTVFDCNRSYFRETNSSTSFLEHEQGHFDIAEVFARRFLQELATHVSSYSELVQQHEKIYKEMGCVSFYFLNDTVQ